MSSFASETFRAAQRAATIKRPAELPPAPSDGKRARHDIEDDAGTVGTAALVEKITDPHKLQQRQKQIDLGKNTLAYERYARDVKRHNRQRGDPRTPDITEPDSKRQFDGRVKEWRRKLHQWESEHPEAQPTVPASACPPQLASVEAGPSAEPAMPEVRSTVAPSHPLGARASSLANQRTAAQAEVQACLEGPPLAAGLTAVTRADLDAYLDAALDEDDEDDDEDADVAAITAPAPALSVVAPAVAAPSVLASSVLAASAVPPRPRSIAAQMAIFGGASSIDDGLVG